MIEYWRHKKTGGVYSVLAEAELQCSTAASAELPEGTAMIVYKGADGKFWVQPMVEFMDGRFDKIGDDGDDPVRQPLEELGGDSVFFWRCKATEENLCVDCAPLPEFQGANLKQKWAYKFCGKNGLHSLTCDNCNRPIYTTDDCDDAATSPGDDPLDEETTMNLTFGDALEAAKRGHKIQRAGWNGKNMHVRMQRPDENNKMTRPYLYMKTADDQLVPWTISQTDAIAEDWGVL